MLQKPLIHIHDRGFPYFLKTLLESFIQQECHDQCIFLSNLDNTFARRQHVMILCDWQYSFIADFVPKQHCVSHDLDHRENYYYIIFNVPPEKNNAFRKTPQTHHIRGLFYRDESLDIFLKGFKAILNGEIWVPREVLLRWVSLQHPVKENLSLSLSDREVTVLKLLTDDFSNKDISEKLYISCNTVKTHLYNIYKKINVGNRTQAAKWARMHLD